MRRTSDALFATAVLAIWLASPVFGQVPTPTRPDLGRLAGGQGAQVFNRTLTAQKEGDRSVARLDARAGDGGALIEGVQLGDGVIEVDLRGKDVAQQSFLGVAFHVVDWTTYDAVYFRPFNFRAAGEEQRAHSVQYISHPANTWQKLRADRPGQFEKAIDPPPDPTCRKTRRQVVRDLRTRVRPPARASCCERSRTATTGSSSLDRAPRWWARGSPASPRAGWSID